MTTPDLIEFIRNQTADGVSRDDIAKMLLKQGWTMLDVEEGYATLAVEHPLSPVPPTAPLAPKPAATASFNMPPNTPPTINNVSGQPPVQQAAAPQRLDPMSSLTRSSQYNAQKIQTSSGKKNTKWMMILVIVLLLVLGSMTAYAYFEKIGPFTVPI